MANLKSSIRNVFKKIGYDIVKYPNFTPSNFDKIYQKVFTSNVNELSIFDIGSHRGESIERFKRIFDKCKISAFEPDSENFASLSEKFSKDESIKLNNCGIGNSNGSLKFHKYKKTDVGGFNKIDPENTWTKIRSQQSKTTPEEFNTSSYEVDIRRLDDYIEENSIKKINLLKIDTQGFEDEVLKGCKKALENKTIDYIELELIIKGPYERTLSFKDIEDALHPYGYKLYGIQNGSNYYYMPILQFDLLFARNECYIEGDYPR